MMTAFPASAPISAPVYPPGSSLSSSNATSTSAVASSESASVDEGDSISISPAALQALSVWQYSGGLLDEGQG